MLLLWDLVNGKCLRQFVGHERGVNDVSWGADGSFFASASDDTTVRIWDVEYGRCDAQRSAGCAACSCSSGRELLTLTGHESYVFSVEFSPHRNSLVSGSFDHSVRVWDCRCGQCARLPRALFTTQANDCAGTATGCTRFPPLTAIPSRLSRTPAMALCFCPRATMASAVCGMR